MDITILTVPKILHSPASIKYGSLFANRKLQMH
jgi:hypothetical protein